MRPRFGRSSGRFGVVMVLHQVRVFGRVFVEARRTEIAAEPRSRKEQLERQDSFRELRARSDCDADGESLPDQLTDHLMPTLPRRRKSGCTAS